MLNVRSLRLKTLGILVLLLCLVGTASFGTSAWLLVASLSEFEQTVATERLARVESALYQDAEARVRLTVDYAVWDDAARHLFQYDEQFLRSNFTFQSMGNAQTSSAVFLTTAGKLHSSVGFRAGQRISLAESSGLIESMRALVLNPVLVQKAVAGNAMRWIDGRPFLLVFSPVRGAEDGSPQVGWLVMAHAFDLDNLRELVQTTGASFEILQARAEASKGADLALQANLNKRLSDTFGPSDLVLRIDPPPPLDSQRRTGLLLLLSNTLLLVLLAAGAAVFLLDRLILKRLALFASMALRQRRGESNATPQAWPVQGRDELDQLALALNGMMDNLGAARADLERDVRTDALTGLGNRRLLYEQLDHLMGQQGRHSELTVAVLLVDLDDFKLINDSLGHEAGNYLLQQIARTLEQLVRASDVVTRLGGDEFALIYVAENGELGVQQFVRRVQQAIALPLDYQGSVLTVTGSVGIAFANLDPGKEKGAGATLDKDNLLRNADLAMYAAKKAGKGRYSFFADAMLGDVQQRMQLEQRLRECLRLDQLEVWFQPIIDVRSGEVAMFEALARWPLDGGYCSPERFIPVAEETGMITELGAAVARKVIEALPSLLAVSQAHVVNVNLSPKQLMNKQLVAQMCDLIDAAGLLRSSIHFELTESALAHNADFAKQQLDALAEAGFHLHLDDFGTGYSSLHRLQSLPFSTLKLDRSFVLMLGEGDERISKAIILLAEQLGMSVIAEGIETAEQQARLQALGCHLIQGYLNARPMPLAQLLLWLEQR
ncbi:bifunctional diguanylate cyclase/phosphodiesterase [Roseateles oligotrophus]|uniref:EAL domain-containing protein n=1 Tax=Roseateles oligotrophus TaxID=1769250 RepID=A0ABT2YJ65_9BURK|nr:EAL domain-containing protein [Roseateles oligotrophus]MCV2370115.1 EAL domain-containing protein [Roseateles oligotrophus]